MNQTAVIFIFAAIPFTSILLYLGYKKLGILALPFVLMFSSCILFNRYKFHLLAQATLIIGIITPTFLYSVLFGSLAGVQYVYFTCVASAFGLFKQSQKYYRIALSVVSIFLFYFVLYVKIPPSFRCAVLPEHLNYVFLVSTGLIFAILFATGKFYTQLAEKYHKQTTHLLKLYGLTEREGEIIEKLISGKTNKEIATALFIEEGTVKIHLNRIYQKTNVKNRLALLSLVTMEAPGQ